MGLQGVWRPWGGLEGCVGFQEWVLYVDPRQEKSDGRSVVSRVLIIIASILGSLGFQEAAREEAPKLQNLVFSSTI